MPYETIMKNIHSLGCLFLLIEVLFLAGCESKQSANFGEHTRILTDSEGNRYFVKHNIGGTYTVEKADPE